LIAISLEAAPLKGFCEKLPGRGELGDRSTAAPKNLAGLAGVEDGVVKESCFSECSSSLSLSTTGPSFSSDAGLEEDVEAIAPLVVEMLIILQP
jgi:hypothetical protein